MPSDVEPLLVVVVEVAPQQWKVAKLVAVDYGAPGPVVATYQVAPGLPYDREASACVDARLVLARAGESEPW